MTVLSKEVDEKVLQALHCYSEYKVARMYNIRVAAVRSIRMEHNEKLRQMDLNFGDSPTGRSNKLRNDELLQNAVRSAQLQYKQAARNSIPISLNYADIENRICAFYASQTGHTLLDTLREHEIYNQQQLIDALDFDKQADSLPAGQALLLARRLLDKVYSEYVNNQTRTSPSV